MNKLSITVIMPTFNGGRYLENQIESILCQLKKNDKLLILDDGSTDNTTDILNKYKNNDFIEVFYNPHNIGVNKSFFKLIEKVKTQLCIFCDQDDVWLRSRVDFVRNNGTNSLTLSNFNIIFSNNVIQKSNIINISIMNTFFFPKFPGCSMGGSTSVIKDLLIYKPRYSLYDQYILSIATILNVPFKIDINSTINYRRHKDTVTQYGSYAPNGIFTSIGRRITLSFDLCIGLIFYLLNKK